MAHQNRSDFGDAERMNRIGAPYLPGHIGVEVVDVGPEEVLCRMAVRPNLLAPNGFLHAAAVVGLADTACGYGTMGLLPEGAVGFTTIELKSNFTGTAREGVLVCRARPIHRGRLTQVWDAVVGLAETERPIAYFRCTQMVLFASIGGG
jgi:uncharacterized protein (TIGR00369 family)